MALPNPDLLQPADPHDRDFRGHWTPQERLNSTPPRMGEPPLSTILLPLVFLHNPLPRGDKRISGEDVVRSSASRLFTPLHPAYAHALRMAPGRWPRAWGDYVVFFDGAMVLSPDEKNATVCAYRNKNRTVTVIPYLLEEMRGPRTRSALYPRSLETVPVLRGPK